MVSDNILLKKNDLITPSVTSLENIGKIAVIDENLDSVTAGGFVYIFRPYINNATLSIIISDFISSSLYQSLLKKITKKSGQAFYNMNKDKLLQLYFPLAPLTEQIRIVNMIDTFETLIQHYNNIEKELSKLEKEFPEKLKKSILQYAIEGKLVKQDPNDEPASVLLERIKQEKEILIKEGKIKKDKNESYIYQGDDKNYYENMGWIRCYMHQIITLTSGTDLSQNDYSNNNIGIPYITGASNIDENSKIIINRYTSCKHVNSRKNEILLSCKGTIGKIVINSIGDIHIARQFMSIKSYISNSFLILYLNTIVSSLNANAKSLIPGIDRKEILTRIIYLPPIEEQKRICERIDSINTYLFY